ncbi:30S ribosomal protein S12 methylthiotransferase RimO [Desulfobotulus sp. H1]|uniref:Ribosomal protein uS12 methylthiotransferase RimO n=1 Tax=Desulfobotulus pelophilus TaxID=2823377 RepID=A0ABT3NB89_9BACT|nr:30S ribosomal protein S12 methylthiotransferase RimO [Desulfobotulus pelophilus]MCW7754735.1 30S ribosomal protein S12 methylthiotransferase RimO [Desulfobotulus pelophilus]
MKCYIETLGCARNQVDSEVLAGHMVRAGYPLAEGPEDAAIIIVNTCGFIQDAIDDSIDTILELASFRKGGLCRYLIVAGCLPERFQEDIAVSLPEVDFFAGTAAYFSILSFLEEEDIFMKENGSVFCPDPVKAPLQTAAMPRFRVAVHTAYLKIAEGCSRHCTYCIIPRLRGVQRSRSLHDVVAEARNLVSQGVKEVVLVAQETTDWGKDLQNGQNICDLVAEVCDAVGEKVWVRLLYGHPESLRDDLLDLMASRDNFCSYLDLPVQHAADGVLRRMGRHYTNEGLRALFSRIRAKVADVSLRTTLITGFPGETEDDFEILLAFVRDIRFDHLGVFLYSDLDDLPSHRLNNHVPPEVAAARRDRLMEVQAGISWERHQSKIGNKYEVLIEGVPEGDLAEGRTRFQAPEVDGITFVDGSGLAGGDVVTIEVTDAFDYDLAGNVVD